MSIIGLDFGSHSSSIALYNSENEMVEVFADDMGSRCIPCVVAYRGEEVLVGQGALSQQYKNSANTVDNLRNIVERMSRCEECEAINIPALEKSLPPVAVIASYFRHIHNQVKQQVGKVVRDVVVTVPTHADEAYKEQLKIAAKAGGMRIKAYVKDSVGALMAHKFDERMDDKNIVMVVDMGWSKCEISLYEVQRGVIFSMGSTLSTDVCGKSIVDAVVSHCVKDFQRKCKLSCAESKRAMTRLQIECEGVVRILSTAAETTIGIDSLFEGIDYTGRLSRARFEDTNSALFSNFKKLLQSAVSEFLPDTSPQCVSDIVIAGGFSSIPKIQSTATALFPGASLVRSRVDPTEVLCLGACRHGMLLSKEGVLESGDAIELATGLPCLSDEVFISSSPARSHDDPEDEIRMILAQPGTIIPFKKTIELEAPDGECFFEVFSGPQTRKKLGQIIFDVPENRDSMVLYLNVSIRASGSMCITISCGSEILAEVNFDGSSDELSSSA